MNNPGREAGIGSLTGFLGFRGRRPHFCFQLGRALESDDPSRIKDDRFPGFGIPSFSSPFESDFEFPEPRQENWVALFKSFFYNLKRGIDDLSSPLFCQGFVVELRKKVLLPFPFWPLKTNLLKDAVGEVCLCQGHRLSCRKRGGLMAWSEKMAHLGRIVNQMLRRPFVLRISDFLLLHKSQRRYHVRP